MTLKTMVMAPVPILTVTIEADDGEGAEIHVHAGGQGLWQARVLASLDVPVVLCGCFGGESGGVVQQLVRDEGIAVRPVARTGANGAYVHDRRSGERVIVAETPGDPLTRHELDDLYNAALAEGLRADICLLSGPADPALVHADAYRRLAHDLRSNGKRVIVDLTGPLLEASLAGGVDLLKISHEEVLDDGRAAGDEPRELVPAMRRLREQGADTVVVSRADRSTLALVGEEVREVVLPHMEVAEPKGAGDSMTAGMAAGLARGLDIEGAVRLGAAAGALNVTRHGLGTVHPDAAEQMARRVTLRDLRL
ncbi:1-phosphofructokinase family hexose kinase [Allostreptomyces psammosilenae]|uniref:1-phosphofructokinase n=1 Tax=Allostreptomyces psammosilenae TaxID=1892865 RepID=A0A852ZS11_9ACTN|nr:PfkB family carbohydrate kinase [Allostreptomyces psammosilenae]NYI03644.1 1-phosphofructokinase [Allostreptomyces psammosilenae]